MPRGFAAGTLSTYEMTSTKILFPNILAWAHICGKMPFNQGRKTSCDTTNRHH